MLHKDRGRRVLLGVPIERRATGRVMAPLTHAMRQLHPLMRHSLDLNRMLLGLRLDAFLLRQDVEPAGAAVLLLSPHGALIFANPRAERMLTEGLVLRYDHLNRLSFPDPIAQARLEGLLGLSSRGRRLTVHLGSGEGAQDVGLMPVPPDVVAGLGIPFLAGSSVLNPSLTRPPRSCLLVVVRPSRRADDEVVAVADRLGLTRAEAAITMAFVDGATLAEIADARGVSIHTVRVQVKSALSKAGVRRQIDLVRLVARSLRSDM